MSILALGTTRWVKRSYTATPTNTPAWHRKEKICFCLFKNYIYLCHMEFLCESLDQCFPVVFPWRKPKNNFSHINSITAKLLSRIFNCTSFAVYDVGMYVRLGCKKKIEQFFILISFIYFFFQLCNQTKIFLSINMKVMVKENMRFIFSMTLGFFFSTNV